MDKLVIRGGNPLLGTVRVSGAKNAALPAMAAALLTEEPVILENIPQVRDIEKPYRSRQRGNLRGEEQTQNQSPTPAATPARRAPPQAMKRNSCTTHPLVDVVLHGGDEKRHEREHVERPKVLLAGTSAPTSGRRRIREASLS